MAFFVAVFYTKNMKQRPRRNRKSQAIRDLVQENSLTTKDFIAPLFILEGSNIKEPIGSMPGQNRLSIDLAVEEVKQLHEIGIPCVSLFPACPDSHKTPDAAASYDPDHFYQAAIREIKSQVPEMLIMTDVAMDPYSSDGHDGLVDPDSGEILNDETLEILAKMAVCQAASGSDIVGPSDMMDGRVKAIRKALDKHGHKSVSIMSYTAKYCSAFYGPFREALDSAPKAGDKKTYQMNPANVAEAEIEAYLDEQEGADILMVKPGLPYLDVVRVLRQKSQLPIAVYNVSGEYAMIKAAAEKGWLDGDAVMMEALLSFKRAGADMILTYFAKEAAALLNG